MKKVRASSIYTSIIGILKEKNRVWRREKIIKLSRKEHMSKVGEEVYQYMYESK